MKSSRNLHDGIRQKRVTPSRCSETFAKLFLQPLARSNYQTGSKSVFKEAGTGTSCLEVVAGEGDLGQACLQAAVILG